MLSEWCRLEDLARLLRRCYFDGEIEGVAEVGGLDFGVVPGGVGGDVHVSSRENDEVPEVDSDLACGWRGDKEDFCSAGGVFPKVVDLG